MKGDQLDQELRANLLETRAVDFEAIGAALSKYGPQFATISDDDGWENFCLTMKLFVWVYRRPRGPLALEDLSGLREAVNPELRS